MSTSDDKDNNKNKSMNFPDRVAYQRRQRAQIFMIIGLLLAIALLGGAIYVLKANADRLRIERALRSLPPPPPPPPPPAPIEPIVPPKPKRPVPDISAKQRMAIIGQSILQKDRVKVLSQLQGMQADFRNILRFDHPELEPIYEAAHAGVRNVPGVVSSAWINQRNLFIIADAEAFKRSTTLSEICTATLQIDPANQIMVFLQNVDATSEAELVLLSRNCAYASNNDTDQTQDQIKELNKHAEQEKSEVMKILEKTTPTM